jgi:hypothetical protein
MTSPKDPDRTVLDHSMEELREQVRSSPAPAQSAAQSSHTVAHAAVRAAPAEPNEPPEGDKTEWMARPSLMQLMASRDAAESPVASQETRLHMQAIQHPRAESVAAPTSPPPTLPASAAATDEPSPRHPSLLSRLAPRRILTQFRREIGHPPASAPQAHASARPHDGYRSDPPQHAGNTPHNRHASPAPRRMERYEPTRTAIAFDLPPRIDDPIATKGPRRVIAMARQLLSESSPQARIIFLVSMTASFLMFATILWKRAPSQSAPDAYRVPASASTPTPVAPRMDKTQGPRTSTATTTSPRAIAQTARRAEPPSPRNAVLQAVPSVSPPNHPADEQTGSSPQALNQALDSTSAVDVGTPESIAIGKVLQGRYREALAIYKELLATHEGHIVYQSMVRILERKLSRSCANGPNGNSGNQNVTGERCDSTR